MPVGDNLEIRCVLVDITDDNGVPYLPASLKNQLCEKYGYDHQPGVTELSFAVYQEEPAGDGTTIVVTATHTAVSYTHLTLPTICSV